MKLKKLAAIIMAATVAASMAGCGSSTSGASGGGTEGGGENPNAGIKIGINVKTLSNSYFREIAYGAILACEDLGLECSLTTNSNNTDLAGQIQNCEDMLNSGISALLITPQNSDGIAPLIDEYNAKNVPVVVIDTAANNCDPAATITMDEIKKGGDMARILANQIGGSGKVIFLPGVPGTSSSDNMQKGAEDVMAAEFPNITLITQHAFYSQEQGQQVMADLLQSNSDVKGVMALNDMMILGAVVSLEEKGYKLGEDVQIVCMSIDPVTARYIEEGKIYGSLYGSPQDSGYTSVGYALRAIRGDVLPPEGFIPYTLFTKDNIGELIPMLDRVRDYNFN